MEYTQTQRQLREIAMQLFNAETKRNTIKKMQQVFAKSIGTLSRADWEGYVIPTANAIFSVAYNADSENTALHDAAIAAIDTVASEESVTTAIFMVALVAAREEHYNAAFIQYTLRMLTHLSEDNPMRVWASKIAPLTLSNDNPDAAYAEPPDYCPDPIRLQYASDHLRAIINVTKNASRANLAFLAPDVVTVVTSYWLEARNTSVSTPYVPESCADILRKHGANDRLIDAVTEYIDSCKDLGMSNDPA